MINREKKCDAGFGSKQSENNKDQTVIIPSASLHTLGVSFTRSASRPVEALSSSMSFMFFNSLGTIMLKENIPEIVQNMLVSKCSRFTSFYNL